MGDFEGQRWRPYLDKEAREIRDEKLDHLQRKYDGPSDFVKQKLKEEDALTLEEKIQKYESIVEDKKDDLNKLKQIKREREQQDKLRDKKELLKEKQKKLREAASNDSLTREDAEEKVLEQLKQRTAFNGMSDSEIRDTRAFDKKVNSLIGEDVDSLVEDVQRLQTQVKSLNGGREDWFMDLEEKKNEVEA